MSIAHFYGENYQRRFRSLSRFVAPNPNAKIPTPAELQAVLIQTLEQMNADFGSWNTPWGEINRFQRLSGDIDAGFDDTKPYIPIGMASGNWGALAAYGARATENTKRLYGYRGNSFVAVVESGKVQLIEVKKGPLLGDLQAISLSSTESTESTLKVGQSLVMNPPGDLESGQLVSIKE